MFQESDWGFHEFFSKTGLLVDGYTGTTNGLQFADDKFRSRAQLGLRRWSSQYRHWTSLSVASTMLTPLSVGSSSQRRRQVGHLRSGYEKDAQNTNDFPRNGYSYLVDCVPFMTTCYYWCSECAERKAENQSTILPRRKEPDDIFGCESVQSSQDSAFEKECKLETCQ